MDQKLQDKFRTKLYEDYMELAFEYMANFTHVQHKHEEYAKQRSHYEEKVKEAENRVKNHTRQEGQSAQDSYKVLKAAQDDLKSYKDGVEATRRVLEKIHDEGAGWQDKALAQFEKAEFILSFKMKTPEEIAEDRKKKEEGKLPVKSAEEIEADYKKSQV